MAKKSGFNYFDSFISMANHAYEAAQYLDGIVKNFDPNPTVLLEKVQGIHEIEHRAPFFMGEIYAHAERSQQGYYEEHEAGIDGQSQ